MAEDRSACGIVEGAEELAGASTWELDLFEHLTSHVELEQDALGEYVAAAERTGSDALRYLVGLIVEDEKRHHQMFVDLAASLKAEIESNVVGVLVPSLDLRSGAQSEIAEVLNRLLQTELKDKQELKRLRRKLRCVEDTTLWALLVELMQHDTAKHIAILKFARSHSS